MINNFTYFEACDFKEFPVGGTLSFAKQLISQIEGNVKLVGLVANNEPVGIWFEREINGKRYKYFGICSNNEVVESKLPARLFTFLRLKKYIKKILKNSDIENVFSQTPQFVFVLAKYDFKKFCFLFAGLGNSVALSKYRYLRFLGYFYEKKLFSDLKKTATKVLAAADKFAIEQKQKKFNLPEDFIESFPTRFDDKIYRVRDKYVLRRELNIPFKSKIFITVGRLSYIKGWKLLIDSFKIVNSIVPEAMLIFVGDGEDKIKIKKYLSKDDSDKIRLIGRLDSQNISYYLSSSDIFILGSLIEGWPTVIVEALACGLPVVSTNVSGVSDMIIESKNGYIAYNRNQESFAKLMIKSLGLPSPNKTSVEISQKYSLSNLSDDFNKCWIYGDNKKNI